MRSKANRISTTLKRGILGGHLKSATDVTTKSNSKLLSGEDRLADIERAPQCKTLVIMILGDSKPYVAI